MDKVPIEAEAIRKYLDDAITWWRTRRDASGDSEALCYIDAYQSVRMSLFGQCLPISDK